MREIKFRQWIGDKFEYWGIGIDDTEFIGPCSGGNVRITQTPHQQFTGLHDKNGKEIYEGDILKNEVTINEEFHGNYSYQEVVFNNGGFIAAYLKSEKGLLLPRGYLAGYLSDLSDHDAKTLLWSKMPLNMMNHEIIGNIYENPDLLEKGHG